MRLLNRHQHRALKRNREAVAAALAAGCYDYDTRGVRMLVKDPRAVRVLHKAFSRLIAAGGEPQVMQISTDSAAGFPRYGGDSLPAGFKVWLGVAFDVSGRGTYCLQPAAVSGVANPTTERRLAECLVLSELETHCARAGFPEREGVA
jgi:hypothetical protein